MTKLLALLLLALSQVFVVSVWAQSQPPVPWSGIRDKSCEVYHSAKYKTPIYSAEAMNEHLTLILGVDNLPKLFYRWERPVRYYLEVPNEHPELVKLFEAQMAQVAKYTGLDIARHDKPYIKYNDEKRNNRSLWPQGLNTNAVLIVTKDVRQTVQQNPLMLDLIAGTPQKWLEDWDYLGRNVPKQSPRGQTNYSLVPEGIYFAYKVTEPTQATLKGSTRHNTLEAMLKKDAFHFASVLLGRGSQSISSVQARNADDFTDFDKQFLRVLYGPSVKSGMVLLKVKRLMHEELVDCFNAKPKNK